MHLLDIRHFKSIIYIPFFSITSIFQLVSQRTILQNLEDLFEEGQYEEVIHQVDKWQTDQAISDTLSLDYAKLLKLKIAAYGWLNQFDLSIPNAERVIALLQRHGNTEKLIAEVLDDLQTDYRYSGDFEGAKKAGRRLVDYSTQYLNTNSVDHAAYIIRSAYPYFTFDYPEIGDSLVNIGLEIFSSIGEEMHPDINMAYNCKGIYNKNRGHYAEAAQWYEKAKNVLRHNKLGESAHYVTMLHNMANVQRISGQLDEAIEALEQAHNINEKLYGEGTLENESIFTGLSNCYILKEEYEKGIYYGRLSLEATEKLYGRESYSHIKNESAFRENLLIAGRNEEAIKGHEDLGRRTIAIFGDQSESYSYYLRQVGKGLKNIGKYDEAIDQLLFSLTNFGIDPYNVQSTFKIKKPATYMSVMSEIADSYYRKWLDNNDLSDLKKAAKYVDLGIENIQQFRKQGTLSNSKLLFTTSHSEFIGQAIDAHYALFQATQDNSYIEKALQYMELSKNILFTENIKAKDILTSESISKLEIEKAQTRRNQIVEIETEIEESSEDSLNLMAQIQLDKLYREEADWFTDVSNKYPEFASRHYGNWDKSIAQIRQNNLRPNELILNYLQLDTSYYIVGISKEHITFRMFNDSLLKIWDRTVPKDEFSPEQFSQLSSTLLLPELRSHKGVNTISIMPSGSITFIPFEALPTATGSPLIENYTIRQLINFEFGKNNKQRQSGSLVVAPEYTEEYAEDEKDEVYASLVRAGQWKLPGAQLEAKAIANLMAGKLLKGKDATKSIFKKIASQYGLLHLSMHTIPSDNAMSSALVFGAMGDQSQHEYLTLDEIYNLDLNAQLVTLSACNTGTGNYQPGEGVLSLAHAFGIAGAPSTVMSLWKVPDESTSQIMISFYKFLKDGLPKDEALRQAKLDFLANTISEKQKDPFYWAGFVIVGDVSPLEINNPLGARYLSIIGIALLGILGFYFNSRRRSVALAA